MIIIIRSASNLTKNTHNSISVSFGKEKFRLSYVFLPENFNRECMQIQLSLIRKSPTRRRSKFRIGLFLREVHAGGNAIFLYSALRPKGSFLVIMYFFHPTIPQNRFHSGMIIVSIILRIRNITPSNTNNPSPVSTKQASKPISLPQSRYSGVLRSARDRIIIPSPPYRKTGSTAV